MAIATESLVTIKHNIPEQTVRTLSTTKSGDFFRFSRDVSLKNGGKLYTSWLMMRLALNHYTDSHCYAHVGGGGRIFQTNELMNEDPAVIVLDLNIETTEAKR